MQTFQNVISLNLNQNDEKAQLYNFSEYGIFYIGYYWL